MLTLIKTIFVVITFILSLLIAKNAQASGADENPVLPFNDPAAEETIQEFARSFMSLNLSSQANVSNNASPVVENREGQTTASFPVGRQANTGSSENSNRRPERDPLVRQQRIIEYVQQVGQIMRGELDAPYCTETSFDPDQESELYQSAYLFYQIGVFICKHQQESLKQYKEDINNIEKLCKRSSERSLTLNYRLFLQHIEQSLISIYLRYQLFITPLRSPTLLFQDRIDYIIEYFGIKRENIRFSEPHYLTDLVGYIDLEMFVMFRTLQVIRVIHGIQDRPDLDFEKIIMFLLKSYLHSLTESADRIEAIPFGIRHDSMFGLNYHFSLQALGDAGLKIQEVVREHERSLAKLSSSSTVLSDDWLQGTSASSQSSSGSLRSNMKQQNKKQSTKKKGNQKKTKNKNARNKIKKADRASQKQEEGLELQSDTVFELRNTFTEEIQVESLPAEELETSPLQNLEVPEEFSMSEQTVEEILEEAEQYIIKLKTQWELDRGKKANPQKAAPFMELTTQNTAVADNAREDFIGQSRDLMEGLERILITQPNAALTLQDIRKTIHLLGGTVTPHNNGYQIAFGDGGFKEFFEVIHSRGNRHTLTRLWVKRIATTLYVAVKLGYIHESMLQYFPPGWEHQIYSGRLLYGIHEAE